jgi:hypothetical protein
MKRIPLLVGGFLAFILFPGGLPAAAAEWKVGAAATVITPTNYMWMAGYAGRKKPAEAKVQELYAKALALEVRPAGGWSS